MSLFDFSVYADNSTRECFVFHGRFACEAIVLQGICLFMELVLQQ